MNNQVSPEQLFGYEVVDSSGAKIGTVDNVWVDDATNDTEFIGVKTGWLMGKTHLIPTADAQFGSNQVTVPYDGDRVKNAPSFATDHELSSGEEGEIYSYYGIGRQTATSPTGEAGDSHSGEFDRSANYQTSGTDTTYSSSSRDTRDTPEVVLSEEELRVGKREVEAGRVRLRKVVTSEHREVPVDLRREEVTIERISAGSTDVPSNAFQEQEVEVPVMREEAVVGKETRVTGGVRLNKEVETVTETVGGDVRTEDVEVDRDGVQSDSYSKDRTSNR